MTGVLKARTATAPDVWTPVAGAPLMPPTVKSGGKAGSPDATGPTSGTTEYFFETTVIPATGAPGNIHVWAQTLINRSVTTDRFVLLVRNGAAEVSRAVLDNAIASTLTASVAIPTDGVTDHTVTMSIARTTGTGTATIGTGSQHTFHWIFIPT